MRVKSLYYISGSKYNLISIIGLRRLMKRCAWDASGSFWRGGVVGATCDSCDSSFASNQQFIRGSSSSSNSHLLLAALPPSPHTKRDVMVLARIPVVWRLKKWYYTVYCHLPSRLK